MTVIGHASFRSSAWSSLPGGLSFAAGIEQWAGLGAHETTAYSPRSRLRRRGGRLARACGGSRARRDLQTLASPLWRFTSRFG